MGFLKITHLKKKSLHNIYEKFLQKARIAAKRKWSIFLRTKSQSHSIPFLFIAILHCTSHPFPIIHSFSSFPPYPPPLFIHSITLLNAQSSFPLPIAQLAQKFGAFLGRITSAYRPFNCTHVACTTTPISSNL